MLLNPAPRRKRKLLFACLYLSEGAPIGFIWLALPTRLRAEGVGIEAITWLTAMLVVPWTFKFAWAPLVDILRSSRWTLKHWIVAAQSIMGLALLPLIWLDPLESFRVLAAFLLIHALAAATQDVAIDALCISTTTAQERGQLNGWMQAGMLLGRAAMGGGALILSAYIGNAAVVMLLILLTTFSMILVLRVNIREEVVASGGVWQRMQSLFRSLTQTLQSRNTWLGLGFAIIGGAAFKSLEIIYGPFLIDRGYEQQAIGWFSMGPMIGSMILGSLVGGWLADRWERKLCVGGSLVFIALTISGLAASDRIWGDGSHLMFMLAVTAIGIGLFTASSYALFMDITQPTLAATQFSAFMGATNACEAWSTYTIGQIIGAGSPSQGYSQGMLVMCGVSLMALPLLAGLHLERDASA